MRQNTPDNAGSRSKKRFRTILAAATALIVCVSFSGVLAYPGFESHANAFIGAMGLFKSPDSALQDRSGYGNDPTLPAISITPFSLNFGQRAVGTTSSPQSVIVTNTGDADLVLGTPTLVTGAHFAVSGSPNGTVIAPGETAPVSFTFTPASIGPKTDTATIVSNASGTAPTISLSGNGVAPLSGSVNVGTGEAYTSLTNFGGLFQALNDNGLAGDLTVNITTDLIAETGTVPLAHTEVGGSGFKITVQPSGSARLISGSVDSIEQLGIIRLLGVDRVTFEGSAFGGRSLTIRNTDGTGGASTFLLQDSDDVTINSCVVQGKAVSNGVIALHTNGNSNTSITDNSIVGPASVLIGSMTTTADFNSGSISENDLSNFFTNAIDLSGSNQSWTVTGNEITQGGEGGAPAGIGIYSKSVGTNLIGDNVIHDIDADGFTGILVGSGSSDTTVSGNHIYDFERVTVGAFNGISVLGSAGATVVNNFVSLTPFANTAVSGISVASLPAGGTATVDHNSVHIGGTTTGTSATTAFSVASLGAGATVSARNNIFFNSRTGGTGAQRAAGYDNTGAVNFDFNIYSGTGAPTAANFFDAPGGDISFSAWQSGPPARDASSSAGTAGSGAFTLSNIFVSATDLHAAAVATNPASNSGTPIAAVPTDFDSESRSITTPDSGADEFADPPAPPIVTTSSASNVTGTTSTLNGSANPNESAATGWFRYSLSDPGACNDTFGTRTPATGGTDLGSGNSPVPFSQNLTGLMPDATIYYCAIAQNATGTSFGAVMSFTPQFAAPTVTTNAASLVTGTSATLNGTADPNGSDTIGYFRFATVNPGTCNDAFGTQSGGSNLVGDGEVPFSEAISALSPGTTYFFCAIAQNSGGTAFGAVQQFTTPALNAGISLSANNLAFGNQTVGTTSASQDITITNTGSDPLTLGVLTIAGDTDFLFTQAPSGAVVQPGESTTVSIAFAPTSLGVKTATLSIPNNSNHQPTVELQGVGVMPDIDVSPLSVDFGTVSTAMGAAQQVSISNLGTEDLTITGVIIGTNEADFTTSLVDGTIVQPGTSTQIVVFFNPTATGNRSATFVISSNDADEPTVGVNLTGIAVNPGFLQFSSASYSGNEGDGTISLTVLRVGGSQGEVSAFFSASGGLATAGEACGGGVDYVSSIPFANFADGDTEPKAVLVTICDDALDEETETFDIRLFANGADIGANTQAVVAITDNDEAGQISISGTILNGDSSPLSGQSVSLAGSSTGTATTDGSGAFTFADVTSGSYVVTPMRDNPSLAFDPISRNYPNRTTSVTDANFTAYAPGSEPRTLTVLNGFATPGQQALVPVMLLSQGNEASLTFSIEYDPTLLSGAAVECGTGSGAGCSLTVNTDTPGRIGVSVDPAAATFAAGSREVVRVLFFTSSTASVLNTPVTFTNSPATAETSDGDANPLLTRYVPGSVVFIHGIESDVASRPNGDGVVSSVDVAQVRRFAVGLDTFDPENNEFQRADSSPYATAGDGFVAATDITQARRYQIGTDPTQPAGGPGAPSSFSSFFEVERSAALPSTHVPRVVRVVDAFAGRGAQVTVPLRVDAEGDENVYGFSLNYDPAILTNPVVAIGADAVGGNVLANTTQSGRIGFSIDFGSGAMPAGTSRELVKVTFTVSTTADPGQTPLEFADTPAFRETSNSAAQPLETTYANGIVTIIGPTAADASISGRVVNSYGVGVRGAAVTVQDTSGSIRTFYTNSYGYYSFTGLPVGETYLISVSARRYVFATPTRVVSLTDNVADLNFTASP